MIYHFEKKIRRGTCPYWMFEVRRERGRHCIFSSATPLNTPKEPSFKKQKHETSSIRFRSYDEKIDAKVRITKVRRYLRSFVPLYEGTVPSKVRRYEGNIYEGINIMINIALVI